MVAVVVVVVEVVVAAVLVLLLVVFVAIGMFCYRSGGYRKGTRASTNVM